MGRGIVNTSANGDHPTLDRRETGLSIRRYMDLCGYSVEDVRAYLGLGTVQSVYHWLEGISLPSVSNLYALAELLDTSVDLLLRGNCDRVRYDGQCDLDRRLEFYMKRLIRAA